VDIFISNNQAVDKNARPYGGLPLTALAKRIIDASDREALKEFHDFRHLFRLSGGKPQLLAEFVRKLSHTGWAGKLTHRNVNHLDMAYDFTIERFTNLPAGDLHEEKKKHRGVDCRRSFKAFLDSVSKLNNGETASSPIEAEIFAAKVLQRQIIRYYRLSCLEARRHSNPARSRYVWRLNGSNIYVWMPVSISGSQRRRWLNDNVKDPDPLRPGEKARIQAIVDKELGVPCHVPLDAKGDCMNRDIAASVSPTQIDREIIITGLAETVAAEKSRNIKQMRPAIRALGKEKLRAMILEIFQNIGREGYLERKLADAYGLSKSSFSRFAGSGWRNIEKIPALWANTAEALSQHTAFMEAAREAGVWRKVELILYNRSNLNLGNADNE